MAEKKSPKFRVPKGPCDPEPPTKRPPDPAPSKPFDRIGPDPLKWLKLGKNKKT